MATTAPEWSKTMKRVLVVPWSSAPTYFGIAAPTHFGRFPDFARA
jgi:hypothetical protein